MEFVSGIGMLNCDLLFTGMPRVPNEGEEIYGTGLKICLGGGVPGTLINLQGLGVKSKLATYHGDDLFSSYVKGEMDKCGIEYYNLNKKPGIPINVSVAIVTSRDRSFVSYTGGADFTEKECDEAYEKLRGCKIFIMQTGEQYLPLYRKLKQDGVIIVYDTGWDDTLSFDNFKPYLELADYYTPNKKEALKITGKDNVQEAAVELHKYFDKVVIKLDKDGALLYENGEYTTIPNTEDVGIDSTGAGDAFLAGFIYGLYHNAPLRDCVKYGCLTGGKCVTGVGCLTERYNETELLQKFKEWDV